MRFFRSRVGGTLFGGRYFVTSRQGPDGVRAYTVRAVMDDGCIETMGSFQQYCGAVAAARRLAGELDGAAVLSAEAVMANARAARTG